MKQTLLLGSKSQSRQMLLKEAHIPFTLIKQDADETACDWGMPLAQLVENIASHKMNHAVLPTGSKDGDYCFVLTADTLSQDSTGVAQGKPTDRADALSKIKKAREGSRLCTAFCLERKTFNNGTWKTEQRIVKCVHAEYTFNIPDEWLDAYLEKSIGLSCSNAIAIEGYGAQFLQTVHGSYTTIVGLPMFEVRQALQELGFF